MAELAFISINVQLYPKNYEIAFRATIRYNIIALSKGFNAKKLCSRVLYIFSAQNKQYSKNTLILQ